MNIKKQFYILSIVFILIYSFPLALPYFLLYPDIPSVNLYFITNICVIITTVVLVLIFFIYTRKKELNTLSARLKKLQRIIKIIGWILIIPASIVILFGIYNDFLQQIMGFVGLGGLIGFYFNVIGNIGFKSKYTNSTDQ